MTYRTDPCDLCRQPIVRAMGIKGELLILDSTPIVSGTYRLSDRGGVMPLAQKPSAKLAFGVRLYVAHTCAGKRWAKH